MTNALPQRQLDEFTPQLPPGLKMAIEIMTPDYEKEIIALIDSLQLEQAVQPEMGRRYIRAFGWGYDSRNYDLIPTDPLPAELEPLRHVAAEFAGKDPDDFEHCMISRFEPGASIPWLKMRGMWQHLVGISLGNPLPIAFRKEQGEGQLCADTTLAPRTMYLLADQARHDYEHSFPATDQPRWCLWFRDFSDEGRKLTEQFRG